MAQQTIGIGTSANDGTGDTIRDAFDKANDNFTELYTGLTGLLDFKGSTDCSANPNYPAASKGDYYLVSVAGKIGGASGAVVSAGDSFFATADNAGGTQASVGTSWAVVEGNLGFAPVNKAGDTMTGDLIVPAEAYGSGWNGSNEVPTKNDVYDKIETVIAGGGATSLDGLSDVDTTGVADGDVLTYDSGGGQWLPAAATGGTSNHTFAMPTGVAYNSNDTGSFATLGNIIYLAEDISVDALYGAWNNDTIGNVYSMFIATCASNGDITATVATAASTFTTVATGIQLKKFALSAPVTLSAATRYYIALVRTNGTGTSPNKAVNMSGATPDIFYRTLPVDLAFYGPGTANVRAWHAQNSSAPTSSTASGSSTGTLYGVGVRFTS